MAVIVRQHWAHLALVLGWLAVFGGTVGVQRLRRDLSLSGISRRPTVRPSVVAVAVLIVVGTLCQLWPAYAHDRRSASVVGVLPVLVALAALVRPTPRMLRAVAAASTTAALVGLAYRAVGGTAPMELSAVLAWACWLAVALLAADSGSRMVAYGPSRSQNPRAGQRVAQFGREPVDGFSTMLRASRSRIGRDTE